MPIRGTTPMTDLADLQTAILTYLVLYPLLAAGILSILAVGYSLRLRNLGRV